MISDQQKWPPRQSQECILITDYDVLQLIIDLFSQLSVN